jgi:glycogen phosphorylase
VSGVDVWLNNPRRPLEASGTSGMKAAMNGIINCSILDGWWDEGYDGTNGWAIGSRQTSADEGAQDWADAQDLYRLLENEIVPRFYERDANGVPTRWLEVMKAAMATSVWEFSTSRMLQEYVEQLYLPAAANAAEPQTAAAASSSPS